MPGLELRPFAVTGIGSLPFQTAAAAVGHIEEHYCDLPFVPELPQSPGEASMVGAAWPSGWVRVEDRVAVALTDEAAELSSFESRLRTADPAGTFRARVMRSLLPDARRLPRLKLQIPGPMTALRFTEIFGNPAWEFPFLRKPVTAWIARLATELVTIARTHADSVLLVLDDPALGLPDFDAPNPANVALFADMIAAIRESGCSVGLHCCATFPLDLLLLLDLDWVSLDAIHGEAELVRRRRTLDRFLRRGAVLALGVVDAPERTSAAAAIALVERLGLVQEPAIVLTTTCGTGLLDDASEAHAVAALSEAAKYLRLGATR